MLLTYRIYVNCIFFFFYFCHFSVPGSNQRLHIAFFGHDSLVSSNVRKYLRLSLSLKNFTILKGTGQFMEYPSNLFCLMFYLGYIEVMHY